MQQHLCDVLHLHCCAAGVVQEREAALSDLQLRLDRRAAELEELRASTHAALARR
jgi:hypothetical protein